MLQSMQIVASWHFLVEMDPGYFQANGLTGETRKQR